MQAALADPRLKQALDAAGVREPVAVAGVVRATVVETPRDVVLCPDALAALAADPAAGLLSATRQPFRDAPPHRTVDVAREVRLERGERVRDCPAAALPLPLRSCC